MLPGPGAGGADHLPRRAPPQLRRHRQPLQGGTEEPSCSNSYRGASH